MDWTAKYLAQTWEQVGGCWGLYQRCVEDRFNWILPLYPAISIMDMRFMVNVIKKQSEQPYWQLTDEPMEGDCVVMSSVHNVFNHVGFYLDGNSVLHSTRRANTGISKLSRIDQQGYKKHKIYRHAKFNSCK